MCKCTPGIKAPYCGKTGCEWPEFHDDKWVVHVLGSDDVLPHADELAALRTANTINKAVAGISRTEHSPFVVALAKNLKHEST